MKAASNAPRPAAMIAAIALGLVHEPEVPVAGSPMAKSASAMPSHEQRKAAEPANIPASAIEGSARRMRRENTSERPHAAARATAAKPMPKPRALDSANSA